MMKKVFSTVVLLMAVASIVSAQTYVDLKSMFGADAFLETGGTGSGNALDEDGRRIDAGTLPADYKDGSPATTQDGQSKFQFGTLKQASLDSVVANGQTIDVPDGAYGSVDFAMLAASGSYGNPFGQLEFRYADGSKETQRLGPVPSWFSSPTAYDHTLYRYTDDSQVKNIISFATNFGADESMYIMQEKGNGNSGGNRFVDGTGFVLYILDKLEGITNATLGVTVGNNFVISIATDYYDPNESTTEGYTVLANSMELYDGFEHRALGNLKQYLFDVSPYLAEKTGVLYVLLTDATTSNGWGPYIQNISLFTGSTQTFEETLQPAVDTSKATVYASFLTNGGDAEKPYLFDNSGSGPSNRGHRFADGGGSITYRFDLPNDAQNAKLTMDMANNFIVGLSGPSDVVRYDAMTVGSAEEKNYLIDDGGSIPGGDYRFADGTAYMIYQFDLPDDVSSAFAKIHIGNEFIIEAAVGTDGEFTIVKDWVAESGEQTHDNSNLDFYIVDISKFLTNNTKKIVRFRFSDGVPTDGWGPYLKSIAIVNKQESGESEFQEVLNSQTMYGADIHNEYNKKYYTIDLSTVLQNNPNKEFYVKLTDGSTGDGWGPGIFWMAVYSGEIDIQSDQLVFDGLKTTAGDPANYGVNLLHRRYALNSGKTLKEIALPSQPADDSDQVYLFAATLNSASTPVSDWMLIE